MLLAFRNGKLLTDAGIESERTLLVRDGRIEAVVGAREVIGRRPRHRSRRRAAGARLHRLPGQRRRRRCCSTTIRRVDTIAAIARAHRRFGTTGFLPTLISDDLDVVAQAIDAVRDAIARGVPGVLGIHIEGPFLNESGAACTMPASCASSTATRSNYWRGRTAASPW